MKKTIFTAFALGAMVLAGCTKVETVDVPESRAIAFDNFVNNEVKADITLNSLNKFWVFGNTADQVVFENELVQLVNSEWNTETVKYWKDGDTYKFGAYSNGNEQLTDITFDYASGKMSINYSQTADNNNETKDLVVGYNAKSLGAGYSGSDYVSGNTTEKVDFTFYHILSKVDFVFTKDATLNGVDLNIKNIKFKACSTATFTMDYPDGQMKPNTWTSRETPTSENQKEYTIKDKTVSGTTTGEKSSIEPLEASFYLIPQWIFSEGGPALKITFDIEYDENKLYYEDVEGTSMKTRSYEVSLRYDENYWNPGFHYVYTATINASNLDLVPIEFTVTEVYGWTDENNDTEIGEGNLN